MTAARSRWPSAWASRSPWSCSTTKWLALIKVKQIRRQFPLYGTELQTEEYTEPPQHYFGVPAVGVRSPQALESAVKTALAAKGPTVIEAMVDSDHYVDTVYD